MIPHLNDNRIIRAILPALMLLSCFCSCKKVTGDLPVYEEKNRTILIYMVGNNNLAANAVSNLEQLKQGYIPQEDGNLIVYYHTTTTGPSLLHITKENDGGVLVDTVYRFPSTNSATTSALISAMNVTKTLYPAKEYGLMLWSHATGWLPEGYYNNPTRARSYMEDAYASIIKMDQELLERSATRLSSRIASASGSTRSFGSEDGVEIEIPDLASTLPYKLSFILFDACLMGGIETAYELKENTDYIMFCPTEILARGYPYSKIMSHLFEPTADLVGAAEEVYNYYATDANTPYVTISLVETSALDEVAAQARILFDAYRENIETITLSDIQPYFRNNNHWFYDLGSFMKTLAGENAASPFIAALNNAVIYKAATDRFLSITIDKSKFYGISTYIPKHANETLDSYYTQYKWNKAVQMIQSE